MEKCNQSVERIFDVIELVASAEDGLGISEISRKLDYPKSTVYRIASSLVSKNYFQKDTISERYKLNYRFIAIAGDYVSKLDIRTVASPYIHKLSRAVNATGHIAIMQNYKAVYIEKIQPYSSACAYSEIGKSIDLYCSGLGKALLLGLSEREYNQYINNQVFEKFTNTTLSKERLKEEIKLQRKTGIAIDNAEHEEGIYCLATPIYDFRNNVVAAISISTSRKEIFEENIYKEELLKCGKEISKIFGKV